MCTSLSTHDAPRGLCSGAQDLYSVAIGMRPELEQAVTELRTGTPEAVDRALSLLQQTVFAFSMKVCGHREDAEDTAQETLLRTAPQLPSFASPQALAVWLYKVARSRCLMSRRRSKFAPREHLSLDELL